MKLLLAKKRRKIAFLLLFFWAGQILQPALVYALTGGPTQPEMRSFQQAGVNEMIDLFSGDFSYNIPLFELPGPNGGYPFNLSYQSGITMEQEASWAGLGWSLNPGAITRQVRGLPDDFKGDLVSTEMNLKPTWTVSAGGGVGVEFFGMDFIKGKVGVTYRYNNYKGFGYAIDANLGFSQTSKTGFTAGLAFSLDPEEGIGLSPNIGLAWKTGSLGLSASYHSATGLQQVSFNAEKTSEKKGHFGETSDYKKLKGSKISAGGGLSFSFPGYTPQINFPMKNYSFSGEFKVGAGVYGFAAGGYIKGAYSEQRLAEKNVARGAYGYLNLQEATRESLMDINREKDGIISRETPNLAIPNLTYDIYSVTGQGIGGMYRPMRNDYGTAWDASVAPAKGIGIGLLGGDINPPGHWGVNAKITLSTNESGSWGTPWNFENPRADSSSEPWCFKVHGEQTATPVGQHNRIGGDSPFAVAIGNELNPSIKASSINNTDRPRLARNQVIQTYSVGQLKGEKGRLLFPLFKNEFYKDSASTRTSEEDRDLPDHHIGAYTALTPDGVRYNYGIPARNLIQKEATFAAHKKDRSTRVNVGTVAGLPSHNHSNTDEFLKITTTPEYAHSYLLTSITGPDYVDVAQDGITPDDLGYWVKFTYRRVSTDYQWRDPFSGAHLIEGWKSDKKDDKGQYTYGQKEIWYLAKAETKSHIAEFSISPREDGRGAKRELQDDNAKGRSLYKLDEVKLYSRIGEVANPIQTVANPIQTVRFAYDYTLCPDIKNRSPGLAGNNGKLTLKSLTFKYGASVKGEMNPYKFEYGYNPKYSEQSFDRWGNYKPCPEGDPMGNIDFPYVNQDPGKKADLDREISAWSLKEITLPNGGKIKVDYEADDYAYVQHLPAMQMMEIAPPESGNELGLSSDDLKICFKLEKSIDVPSGADWALDKQADEVKKYLDMRRGQLYFKCLVYLRKESEPDYKEFISGYIDIDRNQEMRLIKEGDKYVKGSFYVQAERDKHPISMRAWQHLRVNQPELSNLDVIKEGNAINKIIAMTSTNFISHIGKMLRGFNSFCDDLNFGKKIVVGKSWIRLFSPDKIKYGGGLRVKQLTQTDEWDAEGIYGSCYDYTCEQGGEKISSGVAAYEPMAGGEEISLRHAKKYTNSVPLRADNNLFFEYPINESYYPGPQVGYSKVTVRSLVAAAQAGIALNHTEPSGRKILPSGNNVIIGVSGVSVHEFYTAREFPVITHESGLQSLTSQYNLTIPLLGAHSMNRLAGSQGYSVITNDMHGKPKKVSQYRIDKNGVVEAQPISWVSYAYRVKENTLDGERICVLDNKMKEDNYRFLSPPPANAAATHCLGQETDFFLDTREFIDNSWSLGVNSNVDLLFLFFFVLPIPAFFPNVSTSRSSLHTAVTNKAIFRSGILETTEVYNEGSLLKTKILAWDKNTGAPVLQQINNNYDKPIYSLTTPAYTQYNQMGSAAKNIGMEFNVALSCSGDAAKHIYTGDVNTNVIPLLVSGDEIEIEATAGRYLLVCTGTGADRADGKPTFEAVQATRPPPCLTTGYAAKAKIVRSGYRNMITPAAQVLTTLKDPRLSTLKTVTKTVRLPKAPKN